MLYWMNAKPVTFFVFLLRHLLVRRTRDVRDERASGLIEPAPIQMIVRRSERCSTLREEKTARVQLKSAQETSSPSSCLSNRNSRDKQRKQKTYRCDIELLDGRREISERHSIHPTLPLIAGCSAKVKPIGGGGVRRGGIFRRQIRRRKTENSKNCQQHHDNRSHFEA